MPTAAAVLKLIKDNKVKFVDLRFADTRGKWQHMTVSTDVVDADFFKEGKMFDGSSIAGWRGIQESDMVLMPDLSTAKMDPFFDEPTLNIICDVVEPVSLKAYRRGPRSVAKRAEAYLRSTKLADICYFGPELEFFVFDDARWKISIEGCFYQVESTEAAWNSGTEYEEGNMGHRPLVKGGYLPVPPVDSAHDLRSAMALTLKEMGLIVETHHHEVATANQNEIDVRYKSLLEMADGVQTFKYVIHNVAHMFGKTVTFMPKPLMGDNGNGMHCHQSLAKAGKNLFVGNKYAGLSEMALYYIGGIIKHARALNAFTNPSTNSYKRLVPGFEAPVALVYSQCNRSAAIRIPSVSNPKGKRIEVRFPDPLCNPYLAFSAMMMAGLDGIKHKIHPGSALDKNIYELTEEEVADIPMVCGSLEVALNALRTNHEFLLEGDVFNKDLIEAYIKLKMEEVTRLRMAPHPLEFEMYYSG